MVNKDVVIKAALKLIDAAEEVTKMDELQLQQARKHFKWAYLVSTIQDLKDAIGVQDAEKI